jgi:hypothetical protein
MNRFLTILLLGAPLAFPAAPAAADDASDFFSLFDRTCAKSLKTPAAFVEAAKAAGARFSPSASLHSEAEAAQSTHDVALWVMDGRKWALTLAMRVTGSGGTHILTCVIQTPPGSGVTRDAAVAHIRAVMGLAEPSTVELGHAAWVTRSENDQQTIVVDVPAPGSDGPAQVTVTNAEVPAPPSPAEAALQAAIAQLKLTLPRAINDSVTVTDVRVEGMTVVYVAEVKAGAETQEMSVLEYDMKQTLCASDARAMFQDGISVAYEYWTPAPERKLLGTVKLASCP